VCPKCSHVFVLDKTVDVQVVKSQITDLENEKETLAMGFDSLEMAISQIEKDKEQNLKSKRKLSASVIEETQKIEAKSKAFNVLNNDLQQLNNKADTISGKIKKEEDLFDKLFDEMFDSAYLIVDQETKGCEQTVLSCSASIKTAEGTIETYRKAIKDLDVIDDSDSLVSRLEKSLTEYEEQSRETISVKQSIEEELNAFKLQEQRFIEFKTHLANSKIDALSLITNEFLERIGSDIRIRFSGYTVLKSGKIRDKISISLIRNGIDCGSFDKFSEGEKARVNLANILAMHKLTNVNCLEGKGLDLLVLDEILEATDETGLANIFETLNSLQITSLVVSHGNIAENYPHKLVVNKKNGISFINGKSE
jgi:exonuclease SbcC